MVDKEAIIQANGLSKYYGERIALRGATFTIAQGECVGFLGRNGAGKSTLLKILATALLPSAGTVRIGKYDAVNDPDQARRLIGFLPEEPPLYPEMTVRAYLSFLAKLRGVSSDNLNTRLSDVASSTSLTDVLDDAIGTLSLGYRKRVGIAQAIVHQPAVVIVDEPVSGLDPAQIVEIRKLIRSLRGTHTVLVSSHILTELAETCDRFMLIDRGNIVAHGTEAELTKGHTRFTYSIEVRGSAAALEGAIAAVSQVKSKSVTAEGDLARATVELTSDTPEALASRIAAAGLPLRKLAPIATDLESVFLEITGNATKDEGAAQVVPAANGSAA